MLYEFNFENNATQTSNWICLAYGDNAFDVRTCQKWFASFKPGDLNDKDSKWKAN